ncbi:hypothetical protein [Desertibaculum subflavum]|uniref:hypothetical protein n=1 Tax=Desertibaculum subflavum TaxID=2268458 RepID=UPI0034D31AF9
MRHQLPAGIAGFAIAFGLALSAQAEQWQLKKLVPGSHFHGIHGIKVAPDGALVAGSVVGQSVYRIDPRSGTVRTLVGPPEGMADDVAFAADGTMAWTAFLLGDVYSKKGDAPFRKLASGLPGINSLAWRKDGRLYATQVFLGDALYEIDPKGEKPARKIMEGMGGLNSFVFGPDDKLYGPLWFKGQVVRIDVDTAKIEVVAEGFKIPAAIKLDSKGDIWVADTARGQLVKVDRKTGAKKVVAWLNTSIDNLAIGPTDRVFVTNMADNAIEEVNPKTGAARTIVSGRLSMPGGLAVVAEGGAETVYVADLFAYRSVDTGTGNVATLARMHAEGTVLEYPFNVTANAKHVVLSSWFTGTVEILDRKTGAVIDIWHNFKAPHDAVELADGSVLVAELGTGSLVQVSGRHGDNRKTVAKDLPAPSASCSTAMPSTSPSPWPACSAGSISRPGRRPWSRRT